jgi:CRISPR-associated endonuclease/helicase Cas3
MDLVLHLIASHHGHARPFAPLSIDPEPPSVCGQLGEYVIKLSTEKRTELIPAHRLDSGIPERFWRLTRRYGWWGLAYLEAILRLGDWHGSVFIISEGRNEETVK